MKHTRKILVALIVVMTLMITLAAAIIPASAANITTGTKLYLNADFWNPSSARFAAYFFNSSGNAWVDAEDTDGDGIFEVTAPSGTWTNVIFCRMNNSTTVNNWNNKWNQTGDLTYDGTNNLFTVSSWDSQTSGWTKFTGCAKDYDAYGKCSNTSCVSCCYYTITGNSAAVFGSSWTPQSGNKMSYNATTKTYTYVCENVAAGSYAFKCIKNGSSTWAGAIGGSGTDGNYEFSVTHNNSKVTITLTNGKISHQVVEGACYGGSATCTAKAKCEGCGNEYGTALGHADKNADHVCDNGCGVAQGTHAENASHSCTYCGKADASWVCRGGSATCTAKAKCEICGNEYGTALGHADKNADHVCDNGCGVAQGTHAENASHSCTYCGNADATWVCRGGSATCTAKAKCEICGNEYGDTLDHTYIDGKCQCGAEDPDYVAKLPAGKISYRGYVNDSDDREAFALDMEGIYAKNSVVVKIYDANGNLLTTTTLNAGGVEADAYTCNIVLWGRASGSWTTVISADKLTVANKPAKAELYCDGELVDSFDNILGEGTNVDQTANYCALDCVYKAAKVGDSFYASIQDAVNAATAGDTVVIIANVSGEAVTVDKNLVITGASVARSAITLTNVSINANGADTLTVSGLNFEGNSWINSGSATELVVSGVNANVTPSNASYTNSRSGFISLGRNEGHTLALTVENCNIVSLGGSDPVIGWAQITEANFVGNTFGSESAYQNGSDSVKIMSIADGAVLNFTNNTVYSNWNGIVLYQNTTRDNSYTVTFDGNTFLGGADHIWIELGTPTAYHGNVNVKSNNTINGNAVTVGDIKTHNASSTTGYAGIDVVLNDEGKVVGGTMKYASEGTVADGYELDDSGNVVEEVKIFVAVINGVSYETFEEALAAASSMTGDVVVEILDKVTLSSNLSGSYSSITFVGKDTDAEIYLDVQGYIMAVGKTVGFEDLTLSKVAGGYIGDAGFMNLAFGVFGVEAVTYTNCIFANGAYASVGDVTFTGCTFYRSHDRYGMWAYGDADIVVDGCTFADFRGIKMYAEGNLRVGNLTVKNTDFSAVNNKPAIVLTSGGSITLEGNTYSGTGVFELDLDGVPNGTPITSDVYPTCVNDNGACGVLVDGKIYITVADAAAVATSGSTVTLLHNSAETVVLAEGVILDKNGYTADGVSVRVPNYVAQIGDSKYESLAEAVANAQNNDTIIIIDDIVVSSTVKIPAELTVTLDLNGKTIDGTGNVRIAIASYGIFTLKDSSAEQTGLIKAGIGTGGNTVNICGGIFTMESGSIYSLNNAILVDENASTVNIYGGKITAEPTTNNSAVFYVSGNNDNVINIYGGEMVGYNGLLLWNNNTVNITGGTITAAGRLGIQTNGSKDNTEINISGGEITAASAAIYHPCGGELNISGGTLTGATGVVVKGGKVTISGGTINGIGAAADYKPVSSGFDDTGDALYVEHYDNSTSSDNYGTPVVIVTGGTFNSTNGKAVASYSNPNNPVEAINSFIFGGSFSTAIPNEYCAEGLGCELKADGSYGIVELPRGNDFNGFTSTTGIWGDAWGNAKESFVIRIYDANGNIMGTTTLNNIGGIINGNVNVTWHITLPGIADNDEYWIQNWITAPNVNNMPARVALVVDGVEVSGGDVLLNAPDNVNRIVAVSADANGNILGYATKLADAINGDNDVYVVGRGADGSAILIKAVAMIGGEAYLTFEDAYNAADAGDTIVLLEDLVLTNALNLEKGIILDGNGKTINAAIRVSSDATIINADIIGVEGNNAVISIISNANLVVKNSTITTAGNNQFILGADEGVSNASAYIDATLNIELLGVDVSKVACSLRAEYADELVARGYVTKEIADGMITVEERLPYYIGTDGYWYFNGEKTEFKAVATDGATPYIGSNGNWWIGETDLMVKAEAVNGSTPVIGTNGNWWIDGDDTGKVAIGQDGVSPTIGDNGNWFIGETDTGIPAKGQDGKNGIDGVTPHIGTNGNWYIGTQDTGIPATGANGETPYIGSNGNWWIGETDTGKVAIGKDGTDGDTPYIGTNGNWWVGEKDLGVSAKGEDGKTPSFKIDGGYLYYSFDNGQTWTKIDYNLNGSDGEDGEDGDTPFIGTNGNWWIGETDTGVKASGSDGSDGEDGENGLTPFIGTNGNWWIGDTDTGVKAAGTNGINGKTPYIGENGNWFIGNTDTLVPAKGKDGKTPHIGENGNWWIGETDTGKQAIAKDGVTPHIGENGNWFFGTTDTGVQAIGKDGKTPAFKIEEGHLFVSFGNEIWEDLGKIVGDNGLTPTIGENGNWWIGETDTGIAANGADGASGLTPFIGENGNWWIGETDTGIQARGQDGNDNNEIILICLGIATLCIITTMVILVTRKGRRPWWILT